MFANALSCVCVGEGTVKSLKWSSPRLGIQPTALFITVLEALSHKLWGPAWENLYAGDLLVSLNRSRNVSGGSWLGKKQFYRLSDATFYDCINTTYQFIKPFLLIWVLRPFKNSSLILSRLFIKGERKPENPGKNTWPSLQNLAFPHVTQARLKPQQWETLWIKSQLSYPLGYWGPALNLSWIIKFLFLRNMGPLIN